MEPANQSELTVQRLDGPPSEGDRLVIQYALAPAGSTNARDLFPHGGNVLGNIDLQLTSYDGDE